MSADSAPSLLSVGKEVRDASRVLAALSNEERNKALAAIAAGLERDAEAIVAANAEDCKAAQADGISPVLQSRLKLDAEKLKAAVLGVQSVAKLADPLGATQLHRELDTGLNLRRVTCPLGVLGVIFEARPEALIQITSLAVKSGNGLILKGGKEATRTCLQLMKTIHAALATSSAPPACVHLLTTREEIRGLLQLDKYVDLLIPRGSNELVRFVQSNTRIPVLGHADGICHAFVDASANLEKAISLIVDAKTHYPSACNAVETLLVHKDVLSSHLPQIASALGGRGVQLRCDEACREAIHGSGLNMLLQAATEEDWKSEYCDLALAVKAVDSIQDAVSHINTYGSKHTELIISEDQKQVDYFLQYVDAAGVYHNCSTRFADGFRYGFGAEVGISTHKLPPRGPVGLEGLVTYKYVLKGDGHIAATYTGASAKPFTHRDIAP